MIKVCDIIKELSEKEAVLREIIVENLKNGDKLALKDVPKP